MGKKLPETCWADSKINKVVIVHLVGHLYYSPTLRMHGQTQIKFTFRNICIPAWRRVSNPPMHEEEWEVKQGVREVTGITISTQNMYNVKSSQAMRISRCIQLSQKECAKLRESVPYVKVYRYNPKQLCPKLNCYEDNGQIKMWSSGGSTHCTCQLTILSTSALECGFILRQFSSHSL